MIECYYCWCQFHEANNMPDAEPFCLLDECVAKSRDIKRWQKLREEKKECPEISFDK